MDTFVNICVKIPFTLNTAILRTTQRTNARTCYTSLNVIGVAAGCNLAQQLEESARRLTDLQSETSKIIAQLKEDLEEKTVALDETAAELEQCRGGAPVILACPMLRY